MVRHKKNMLAQVDKSWGRLSGASKWVKWKPEAIFRKKAGHTALAIPSRNRPPGPCADPVMCSPKSPALLASVSRSPVLKRVATDLFKVLLLRSSHLIYEEF